MVDPSSPMPPDGTETSQAEPAPATPDQSPGAATTMAATPDADAPDDKAQLPTGPGFALTFLYYFSGSALVATFLAVKSLGYGLNTGLPGQLALIVGAVGGFVGGFFNHTMTLTVPFKSRKQFLKTLVQDTLEPMGYELAEEVDDIRVYRRSPLRQIFSGKIYVEVQRDRAILASRALHIRALRKKLLG
ncbi:MAG: hypothetical protein VKJ09_09365 [Leptolyngbya sp.]|nr:hypothetical protein [Leptolyngbya sp.]